MRNVAVIAASFFLVKVVEILLIDAIFENYYFALLCSTVAVVALCGKFHTPQLAIYAALQFIQGCFYLAIIGGHYYSVEPFLWDNPINFSLILMAYEIAIIVHGVINVIPIFNGMRPARSFGYINF